MNIFITRELSESSYLRNALAKHQIEIDGRSLIRTFPYINKLDPFILRNIDWVFFSSKNAIEYFFKLDPQLPKKVKFGVLGRASEDALRLHGKKADFNGEEEGIDTLDIAKEFAKQANGNTILFPSAKGSLKTIQKALAAETKIIELTVYETVSEENVQQSNAEVLIFTSPSNVDSYFAENLLEPDQKVICIGKTTGQKFDDMGVKYTLPFSPDEMGLAEAIFAID
jgi:uroporphyrinogen-III synthase